MATRLYKVIYKEKSSILSGHLTNILIMPYHTYFMTILLLSKYPKRSKNIRKIKGSRLIQDVSELDENWLSCDCF